MHELTASEAGVLLAVLSRDGREENGVPESAGIPTSTFYATRRKIYDAGWVSDRYVPNPWAIGVSRVDCVLARPGPAQRSQLEREWSASAPNVVLWSGLNVLFGVFFRDSGDAAEGGEGATISVRADRGSLPVYFDYSRLWSRFTGVERETGYPRALGSPSALAGRSSLPVLQGLLREDPERGDPRGRPHPWHSSGGLSRREQGLVDRGLVRSRTFLNLDGLPAFDSRALGEVIFLSGAFRAGTSSESVLAALTNECRVSPLFLADDGKRILIIALGQTGSASPRRARVPRAVESVTGALDARLGDLQMVVEHVDSVRPVVDHRYDRLFPPGDPAVGKDHGSVS